MGPYLRKKYNRKQNPDRRLNFVSSFANPIGTVDERFQFLMQILYLTIYNMPGLY